MALRTRTIEFAYPHSTTSVAGGTARNFTSINLFIPNTTGVTFQSVMLEVSISDNVANGGNLSPASVLLGIGLGAVAVDTATVTQTLTNSGESQSWTFTRDVTAYFTTNWTGTTMTSTARITVATAATINASAKLIISYQFEDTDATNRIKTVKIPIDGNIGTITDVASNIGAANQVPNLSTFLPESSKVFRDIFFECYGHAGSVNNTGTATSLTLNYNLGGVSTDRAGGAADVSAATDLSFKRIDKIETLTTNATSSITARVTANQQTGAFPFPCLSGVLVVTYEYDHATSTSIMNSLQIPVVMENSVMGGTTDANRSLYRTQFFIQEPATITLAQSGILMTLLDGANPLSVIVNCGSQTDRTFAQSPAAFQVSGSRYISRRIDSGAQGGTGITIARGLNNFDVEFYNTSTTSGAIGLGNSVMLYLNYTSGKDSNGDGVHAHTVVHATRPYAAASTTQRASVTVSRLASIPETSYYLVSTGYEYIDISIGTAVQYCQFVHNVQYSATEGPGVGWKDIATLLYHNLDTEAGTNRSWVNTNDIFRKYPDANYPNTYELDLETSRSHQLTISNLNQLIQILQYVTYHSITYTISGTISGSNGGAVSIEAYRADTGEKISSTSRTGNGSYSMTWYDNTINVFVVAYESSTYKGMSAEQVAGNTFDINLSSGGGPTYYSYA